MSQLTKMQVEVLDAIAILLKRKAYAPSIQEIGDKTGLKSRGSVHRHLKNLQKAGYIDWEEGQPRTLKVLRMVTKEDRDRLAFKFEYAF
jgi:SOS-response transcriptional repressor LexA